MRVLTQAGRVLVVGLSLGVALGVFRGFPETSVAQEVEGACLPPVSDDLHNVRVEIDTVPEPPPRSRAGSIVRGVGWTCIATR